jgi:hypothetical protein
MKKTMFVAIAILAIILGIVAYAGADTVTGTGTPRGAAHDVAVSASVNPKLVLTIADADHSHSFGAFDPDATAPAPWEFSVSVASNKSYGLSAGWVGATAAAWSYTFPAVLGASRTSGQSYPASIGFMPSWNTEGAYNATLRFTATQ